MDSHFPHLLLPITFVQNLNEFLFGFLANIDTECSMRVFSPGKRLPAIMPVMKITAPPASPWIDHQLALCVNDDTDEVFLIVPMTAAQTCSLRAMSMVCQ
jgi:hypothetical protein